MAAQLANHETGAMGGTALVRTEKEVRTERYK